MNSSSARMVSMMRLLLLVVAVAMAACSSPPPPLPVNEPAELLRIESALRAYDTVLATGETAKLRGLVTPAFRLHEDNTEQDIDEAITAIEAVVGAGSVERTLRDIVIEQRGPVAWVRYKVHVTYTTGAEKSDFERLESVVMERRDERWVVAFATSMPLE